MIPIKDNYNNWKYRNYLLIKRTRSLSHGPASPIPSNFPEGHLAFVSDRWYCATWSQEADHPRQYLLGRAEFIASDLRRHKNG